MTAKITRHILIILIATVGAVFGLSGCKNPYKDMKLTLSTQSITISLPEVGTSEETVTATITGVDSKVSTEIGLSYEDQQNIITATVEKGINGQSTINIIACALVRDRKARQ